MTQQPAVKILDKTLRILALFTPRTPEWRLTDLAAAAGLPKSTVHRVLLVLVQHELLAQDADTHRFRLGIGAMELGWRAYAGLELRRAAAPVLDRLAAASGETVTLQVLNQQRDQVVCIERAQHQSGLRLILEVGATAPLHAGSSSKILLAFLADDAIEVVIARGLAALTPHTITEPELLRRELRAIRQQGYAVSFEETDAGAAGVSVPIRDGADRVVAGLTIAGPLVRMSREQVPSFVALARDGAREIEHKLGYRRSSETLA